VPAGDPFSARQADAIGRSIEQAEAASGLDFSVYVGEVDGDLRETGRQLLGVLGSRADDAVVIVVDPTARSLEILTGRRAAYHLDDRATALGALAMTTSFAAGDLAGGIVDGLRTLAEHARQPRTLHLEQS
jgi:uncharacterized membrane protein YgcG